MGQSPSSAAAYCCNVLRNSGYMYFVSCEQQLFGAFANLQKCTSTFATSLRLSSRSNSILIGRIFMKIDIAEFF
jgi:hypothetical protein